MEWSRVVDSNRVGQSRVAHSCYLSTQEMEAGGPGVQGLPQLSSKFEAILDYIQLCLKKTHHQQQQKKAGYKR